MRYTVRVGGPVQDLDDGSGGLQPAATGVMAAGDGVQVEVRGEPAGVGPQGGVGGDALHRGGVQVVPVDGVELDERDPQLDVGTGEVIADQARASDEPSLQRAQRPQQLVECGDTFRPPTAGRPGALCGLLDALRAHPLDGLDLRLRATRVQIQPAATEAPGEVTDDVGACVLTMRPDQSSLRTGARAGPA